MEWTLTARKWQEIFREYESQGLKRKEFCAARGLKKSMDDSAPSARYNDLPMFDVICRRTTR